MPFANSDISDIIATSVQSRSGVVANNVLHNCALLTRLKKRGNVKPFSGGNVILQELSFASNTNAMYYSGYQTLAVAQQDVISASSWDISAPQGAWCH